MHTEGDALTPSLSPRGRGANGGVGLGESIVMLSAAGGGAKHLSGPPDAAPTPAMEAGLTWFIYCYEWLAGLPDSVIDGC